MTTLHDRINRILGRECPALGNVSAEGISVIRELEERLEHANLLFQDVWDYVEVGSDACLSARQGINVTDTVADYTDDDHYQAKG